MADDGDEEEGAPESGPRAAGFTARQLDSTSGGGLRSPRAPTMPDVRDGLTRLERVILWQLHELEQERGGRMVPTAQLYGRVVEHVDVDVPEFQRVLARLVGKGAPTR